MLITSFRLIPLQANAWVAIGPPWISSDSYAGHRWSFAADWREKIWNPFGCGDEMILYLCSSFGPVSQAPFMSFMEILWLDSKSLGFWGLSNWILTTRRGGKWNSILIPFPQKFYEWQKDQNYFRGFPVTSPPNHPRIKNLVSGLNFSKQNKFVFCVDCFLLINDLGPLHLCVRVRGDVIRCLHSCVRQIPRIPQDMQTKREKRLTPNTAARISKVKSFGN